LGTGNGTFGSRTDYPVGKTSIRTLEVGDLNNDRFPDLVVPTGIGSGCFVNVLRNDGSWTAPIPPPGPSIQDRLVSFPASSEQLSSVSIASLIPTEPTALTATEQPTNQTGFSLSHRPATIDLWIGAVIPDRILAESEAL